MKNEMEKRHILSLLVDNQPGVLARIAGLFSGRAFNIESLCVAETTDPLVSRVTLVTVGDMSILEQIKKQLNKLINVMKVVDYTDKAFVQREMALIKVRAKPEHRAEILRMVDIFRSRAAACTVSPSVAAAKCRPPRRGISSSRFPGRRREQRRGNPRKYYSR